MSTTTRRCSSRTRRGSAPPRWSARPSPTTGATTRFLPSEGYYLRFDQDLAGLGGDNRYHPPRGRAPSTTTRSSRTVVASLSGSGGYIRGIAGEDVHLSNRFFVGGNNLRGFEFGGIGPRDTDTDDKLGGNLYYVGSAELRFPLGLPEELRIFGRAFVDAGTLAGHRRQRPDPGREQRPACRRRRRPVLAVAARAAVDRLRAGRSRRKTRTRPRSSGCPSAPGSDARGRRSRPERGRPAAVAWRCAGPGGAARARRVSWRLQRHRSPAAGGGRRDRLSSASCARRRRRGRSAIRSRAGASCTRTRSPSEEQRLHEADKELARQRGVLSAEAFAERRRAFESEVAGGAADGAGAPAPARPGRGRGARRGPHGDDRGRGRARRRRAASISSCRPAACCCSRRRSI